MRIADLRQVSSKGKRIGAHVLVWCPGCQSLHALGVIGDDGSHADPEWSWNGNLDSPTFQPSLLVWTGDRAAPDTQCHSFIEAGQWRYLADCTHALAGQTVPMEPIPDDYFPEAVEFPVGPPTVDGTAVTRDLRSE